MSESGAIRQIIHELNNALARILTTAELIATDPGGEQTAVDAESIRAAALDGRELVARLHRYALEDEDDEHRPC